MSTALKRKGTAQELRIFDDRGLAAVQLDRYDGTFRRDDVSVPSAGGFGIGRFDLGEIGHPAGAVIEARRPRVVDVDFVGLCRGDLRRCRDADEDAAIRIGLGPEFGADDEIAVRLLRQQVTGVGYLVGDNGTTFGTPVRTAYAREILE